jgi:hypothetical protein
VRSTADGTNRVHQRLNAGRAITLCWTAKSPRSSVSMTTAATMGPGSPLSMVFGTGKLPTKAMA